MDHQDVAVADELQKNQLLRALEAGWTIPEDWAYVVPVLAWVHSMLVAEPARKAFRAEGENCSYCVGQDQEYTLKRVMATLGVAELSGPSVPSFARHLVNAVFSLHSSSCSATMTVLVRLNAHISAQAIRAIQTAVEKVDTWFRDQPIVSLPNFDSETMEEVWQKLLPLHVRFFTDLYTYMRFHRLDDTAARIQSRKSLENEVEPPIALRPGGGEIMCRESDERRSIEFSVERYPCTAEVLDPRVVRIPPGKYNNRHKHAHETLFYFISGLGEILVGEKWVQVKPGDAVFSPRWAIHQTHNTGVEELVLLAITDYYLTSKIYVGKYEKI